MESSKIVKSPAESKTEYNPEIIRVASYHRHDFDLAVARTSPRDHDQIRTSLLRTTHDTSALGDLQILPLEIIHEICFLLDIRSLLKFRHVSRGAQQIIRTVRGYEATVRYALDALGVILKTNIASWFTISDLFKVLCTRDCDVCGSFGGFIFLPLFMRCCFSCIRKGSLPFVLPISVMKKLVKSSPGYLRFSAPIVKSLPGTYSMEEVVRKKRIQIVTTKSVSRVSLREEDERNIATQSKDRALLRYMVTTSLPFLNVKTRTIQNGICCSGCQVALEKALRSSKIRPNACALRDKIYSYEEFMEHYRGCQEAQILWELSSTGVDAATLSEFVKRGGYFNKRDVVMSFHSR